MAGYSGTPLPKKLGIKDGFRVRLMEVPSEVNSELKAALRSCEIARNSKQALDFVLTCVRSSGELKNQFPRLVKQLALAGMIWISWPKKSSGVATDLDENKVRAIGLETGLVDVKVCAVNEIWSGLKFVIRVENRRKASV